MSLDKVVDGSFSCVQAIAFDSLLTLHLHNPILPSKFECHDFHPQASREGSTCSVDSGGQGAGDVEDIAAKTIHSFLQAGINLASNCPIHYQHHEHVRLQQKDSLHLSE